MKAYTKAYIRSAYLCISASANPSSSIGHTEVTTDLMIGEALVEICMRFRWHAHLADETLRSAAAKLADIVERGGKTDDEVREPVPVYEICSAEAAAA